VAATVIVHSVGLTVLLGAIKKSPDRLPTAFWRISWLLVRLTWWMFFIHLIEISIWGMFYYWYGCISEIGSAIYFSGVTYTTIGYGDVVLSKPWWLFGPIEGLVGILMCGLSAGVFFAVVNRIYSNPAEPKQK
jgi:hypothetical protein